MCAHVKVNVSQVVPTVALLVDQSGSMTAGFGNTTRWRAAYDALMNSSTGVVKQLEGSVRFGLDLFTSRNGNSGGTCPIIARGRACAEQLRGDRCLIRACAAGR